MARTVYHQICLHCQKPFETLEKRKKYCSRDCFIKLQKQMRPTVICENCGASSQKPPSQIKKAARHYCSIRCYYHFSVEERFFEKIEKQEDYPYCWIWKGATQFGYGIFGYGKNRKHIRAHRYSFEFHYGPIPDGFLVMHNCPGGDNPACVNPEHLLLGYPKDNSQDMVKKMRSLYGEKNHEHKLNKEQVLEIYNAKGKMIAKKVIEKYPVTIGAVYHIWHKKTWKHLTLTLP